MLKSRLSSTALAAVALIGAVAMIVFAASLQPQGAAAASVSWEVEMLGANEVPAATSAGSGLAEFTFNDETRELTYSVTMIGLDPAIVTASHIHKAPVGVAGPPVYTLASAPFENVTGTITLTEADVVDLEASGLYVNIHSTLNPSGFARAQIILPAQAPTPAATSAPTQAPKPPSAGTGVEGSSSDAWGSTQIAIGVVAIVASVGLMAVARTAARGSRRS